MRSKPECNALVKFIFVQEEAPVAWQRRSSSGGGGAGGRRGEYPSSVSYVCLCSGGATTGEVTQSHHTVKLMQLRCAGWLALLHYMISPPGGERDRRRASHTTTTPVAARHGAREPNEITNVFTRSFQEPNLRRSCSSTHLTLPRIPPAACIGLRFVIY